MEVEFLNLFKKTIVASLVLAMTLTVGCGSNKKTDTNSSDKTQKQNILQRLRKTMWMKWLLNIRKYCHITMTSRIT